MAKVTKSFSLEQDIIDKIVNYKLENRLSSDSAALERILLQFGSNQTVVVKENKNVENLLNKVLDKIEELKLEGSTSSAFIKTEELATAIEKDDCENKSILNAVDNVFSGMPD